MGEKKVLIYDELMNSDDHWRDLFLSSLKSRCKADIKFTKSFSDFINIEDDFDILIYLKRETIESLLRQTIYGFSLHIDARLIILGHEVLREEIPSGFIGVSQKDFSSEEELINAILG